MKKILFLIFTVFAIQVTHAQWVLDPTFGTGGIAHTLLGDDGAAGHSMVIQSDDKIVIVGETFTYQGAVVRFNADGTFDNSFGNGGKVLVPMFGQRDYLLDVALHPDGKIIAFGYCYRLGGYDLILVRLNPDGTFDGTFGENGRKLIDVAGKVDIGEAILIQPDGKYLLGGYSDYEFTVICITPEGLLDLTFGDGGVVITLIGFEGASSITDLALLSDGKIVAVGNTINSQNYNDFAVARFNADGTPNTTFGEEGKKTYNIGGQHDFLTSVCIQNDGKILLGGHTYVAHGPKYDMVVARIEDNGVLDFTFGFGGIAKNRIINGANYVNDILLQADGKILVAGFTADTTNYFYETALARFNSDGSLDYSFSETASLSSDVLEKEDYGEAVALQSDGKILLAGRSYNGFTQPEMTVLRYTHPSVGIAETVGSTLSIYPNPANHILKIETNSKCKIEILDMLGKVVFSTVAQDQIMVDVSEFLSGLYFVRASSESTYEVIKLIVE